MPSNISLIGNMLKPVWPMVITKMDFGQTAWSLVHHSVGFKAWKKKKKNNNSPSISRKVGSLLFLILGEVIFHFFF
jgi:hypothetical protein